MLGSSDEFERSDRRRFDLLSRTLQRLHSDGANANVLDDIFSEISEFIGTECWCYQQTAQPPLIGRGQPTTSSGSTNDNSTIVRAATGVSQQIANTKTCLVIKDTRTHMSRAAETLGQIGIESCAAFPLLTDTTLIGTIAFFSHHRTHFSSEMVQTVQSICNQLALTVESRRIKLEIEQGRSALAQQFAVLEALYAEAPIGLGLVNVDITERKEAEFRLCESEMHFRNMADHAPVVIWVIESDGRCTYLNQCWTELSGRHPLTGRGHGWLDATYPDDRVQVEEALRAAQSNHEAFRLEHRVLHADGHPRWVINAAAPRRAETGEFLGYIGSMIDITERKHHEDHVQVLMREVNHRSKNMLGLIQSIARQTASTGSGNFLQRFEERVRSLSAAQDLIVKNEWKSVPLDDLIRSQLSHFADLVGTRVQITGEPLLLTPSATQPIGMAIHELATNAAKYGALSTPSGIVAIAWDLAGPSEDLCFKLTWVETGGPTVEKPVRLGFGSTVTRRMVEFSLTGTVLTDYAPDGLKWQLTCSAGSVIDTAHDPKDRRRAPRIDSGTQLKLTGRRILVVEDEPLIAAEIADILQTAGFDIVGPAANVEGAMTLLADYGCDAAVLDVNLGRETSESIVKSLTVESTPFVVISGYPREQLPSAFRAAALIGKPLHARALKSAVQQCLASKRYTPSL